MKYSLVNGERNEAQPGVVGQCEICSSQTIAKCGDIKMHHWAHKGKRICDPWWEKETEWHRSWKNHFPTDWQESIHTAESGEKHIADVKTIKNWVIEFQHSHLNSEERQARNDFYEKLVWVIDGTRRKKDKTKFFESLMKVAYVSDPKSPVRNIYRVLWNDCALFRDWLNCPTPVFFDFGKDEPMLWCLLPQGIDGQANILEFSRAGFIVFKLEMTVERDYFSDLIKNFRNTIEGLSSSRPSLTPNLNNFTPQIRLKHNRPYRRRRL